jgi:hypothetical protein
MKTIQKLTLEECIAVEVAYRECLAESSLATGMKKLGMTSMTRFATDPFFRQFKKQVAKQRNPLSLDGAKILKVYGIKMRSGKWADPFVIVYNIDGEKKALVSRLGDRTYLGFKNADDVNGIVSALKKPVGQIKEDDDMVDDMDDDMEDAENVEFLSAREQNAMFRLLRNRTFDASIDGEDAVEDCEISVKGREVTITTPDDEELIKFRFRDASLMTFDETTRMSKFVVNAGHKDVEIELTAIR